MEEVVPGNQDFSAFFTISMGTIACGLCPCKLMHMELALVILLHCLDAPNWSVTSLIVLVVFWI